MIFCWRTITEPIDQFFAHFHEVWLFYGPAAIASLLLMPLVAWDVIRLSNRFVGPILRMRRAMKALAQGEQVQPIAFREGDFWREFAGDFNAVAERLQGTSLFESDCPSSDEAISIGTEQ
jgi:nitrogen fixation/metabolism regulation signal transduction histidine kinase